MVGGSGGGVEGAKQAEGRCVEYERAGPKLEWGEKQGGGGGGPMNKGAVLRAKRFTSPLAWKAEQLGFSGEIRNGFFSWPQV